MAPEILEGDTLGEKHRYYNKFIKDLSKDGSQEIQKINYNEPDLNNLCKIDIAANKKSVEYIMEILKCEDMLYVSRAIKQSLWLITDKEYAHIINPGYLYSQLLPQMTSKAGNKLILNIRLNLRDEERVEEFYNYYEEKKELETALKWLPNCSPLFIEKAVEKHFKKIPNVVIRKLCKKSLNILKFCLRNMDEYEKRKLLSKATFMLNNYIEDYVDYLNAQEPFNIPYFSPKSTQILMKKRPDIIINNFEKFVEKINIPSFAKSLKKEDIKGFLSKQAENKNLKPWFTFENVKHFIARMPTEGRFDFIKRTCIEATRENTDAEHANDFVDVEYGFRECVLLCAASSNVPKSSNENIYRWYRFAPFDTAFTDLKKLIRIESNASERNAMFKVLMICAGKNLQNVQTVLQYYRDRHINEPFKFKSHFVNIVLTHSNSHRFDDKTWGILNDIFCSMEVYIESENNVQSCIKHIIVYKVVNDLKVPDIVEKKFEFDSLKSLQSKLNEREKDKVFNYLYQSMITKIQNIPVTTETEFKQFKKYIKDILSFLVDWNKDLLDHGIVLEKIRELIQIKLDNTWNEDLSDIYNVKKSWRKHMFKESLLLQSNAETFINALKHDPKILDLSTIFQNDFTSLKKLFNKLRIYWPLSLAKTFEDVFLKQLDDQTKHKISVQGLCVLLNQSHLIEIITKYTPENTKINWGETDELTLSVQTYLAKYMYLARPQPPVEVILLYAKGDYLQYALPSVHSILSNMSVVQSIEHVPKFLDAPVSLQKHGLQFAFTKLETEELLKICLTTWKCNKNASIRATIFKLIFDLLCKEQNETMIKEIWSVLSTFIDTLTFEENKIIYVTLGFAQKVPLLVREAYCVKAYNYLKSVPSKANCGKIIESVIKGTLDIMESIDVNFIAEVINALLDDKFKDEYFTSTRIISACLLSAKSETIQTQRYELIWKPLFLKYIALLEEHLCKRYLKNNFDDILEDLHKNIQKIVFNKDMITPTKLFEDIYCNLKKIYSITDYYEMITTWKLAADYMKIFEKHRREDIETQEDDGMKWNIVCLKTAPEFGKLCMEQLKEDVIKFFPSIYRLFARALKEICQRFNFNNETRLSIIKAIQIHADIVEGHLLVIKMLPIYLHQDKEKEERSKICEILRSHPSAEVGMYFQRILRKMERY
ncbi:uncharacterized protein [Epargyreus clarus]|uniref:uncharacterized protein isoform X2 n=1 Tax=Epargyreus clarus TaxID=520877 RepID=UPI003C2D3E2B